MVKNMKGFHQIGPAPLVLAVHRENNG